MSHGDLTTGAGFSGRGDKMTKIVFRTQLRGKAGLSNSFMDKLHVYVSFGGWGGTSSFVWVGLLLQTTAAVSCELYPLWCWELCTSTIV